MPNPETTMGIQAESLGLSSAKAPSWHDELGTATDLLTAARMLRIGRTKAYRLARQGDFPVPITRIGHTYIVPVAPLLDLLGLREETRR